MHSHLLGRTARAGLIAAAVSVTTMAGASAAKAAEAKPAVKGWETVANVGVTLTRGNSQNFLASVGLNSARKWAMDEVFFGANAAYGETTTRRANAPDEQTITSQYVKGFSQINHLFNQRLYSGLRIDGLYDKVAGVHYRFTVSPMLGYYLIKEPKTRLSVELGPSVITEEVVSRINGAKRIDENTYFAGRVGERFEHTFATGAKIWETMEWIPQVTDFDNWLFNAEAGVSAPVTKKLSTTLVLQDSYDNVPPTGRLKIDL